MADNLPLSLSAAIDKRAVTIHPLQSSRNTMEAAQSQTVVQRAPWLHYIFMKRSPPTTGSSEVFIP